MIKKSAAGAVGGAAEVADAPSDTPGAGGLGAIEQVLDIGGAATQEPAPAPAFVPDDTADRDFDPLLACLEFLCKFHGRPRSREVLRSGVPLVDGQMSPSVFLRAAERGGLTGRIVKRKLASISHLVMPCVVFKKDGQPWVLIEKPKPGHFVAMIPELGEGTRDVLYEDLAAEYAGYAAFLRPEFRFGSQRFDTDVPKPRAWFWGTLAQSWWIYLQVACAAILINIFALANPMFTMNVYDRVLPNNAVETGWVLAIGVAFVLFFDFLLRNLRAGFIDFAGRRADVRLACRVFDQVLDMKMAARPASAGALASTLREFETLRDFFTSATLASFVDLPFVFLFVFVISIISPQIALLLGCAVGLILLVGLFMQFPMRYVVKKNLRENESKHGVLVETLNGFETIKTVGADGRMRVLWEGLVGQSASSSQRTRLVSNFNIHFVQMVQQLCNVGVILIGIYLVGEGEMTSGGLIACVILSGRAIAPMAQVAQLATRAHQAFTALNAIDRLMHLPTERPADKTFLYRSEISGEVQFQNVSFAYPGQNFDVLRDVSFTIKAGERVGFVGRVGSGKSTLAKLLIGLYSARTGSVSIDGTDITHLDPTELRRNVGYVPQDVFLFRGTARENIAVARMHANDDEVMAVARMVGLDGFLSAHPMGYDLPIGERGDGLSGGQRQAISFARTLLARPRILVLDEPTSSMDTRSEENILAQLPGFLENRTLILITHRASLLKMVDRLIVIDKGRVVADGPREAVLRGLASGRIATAK